eukprot:g1495.t1
MFRYIPRSKLFVSEPNPAWFGNSGNIKSECWHPDSQNWLKSRFHFSFAEYNGSGKNNDSFGCLRVMNDDLVQPDRGFGLHPHQNMEICTYVVDGSLTHKDSMGTAETLGRGAIQFMTAGTGIRHSEHNLSKSKHLRFIQMWMTPRKRGLQPNYGSANVERSKRLNKFLHIVSDVSGKGAPVKINQDVNMFVSEIQKGTNVVFKVEKGRQVYILCVEGNGLQVSSKSGEKSMVTTMQRHDAAEAYGPNQLAFEPSSDDAHVLIVEMKYSETSGRTDV